MKNLSYLRCWALISISPLLGDKLNVFPNTSITRLKVLCELFFIFLFSLFQFNAVQRSEYPASVEKKVNIRIKLSKKKLIAKKIMFAKVFKQAIQTFSSVNKDSLEQNLQKLRRLADKLQLSDLNISPFVVSKEAFCRQVR